jgi:hypothetical protein
VLAPSKRRASLYTLPLVVVIGFLSVAGLSAWQRSDVIADLADQVAHGEKNEATAAVRQLAAIPSPPLPILVEAATSDEHAAADAAQLAINRLLSKWQRQVDKKERVSTVAGQLTELAAALAAQRQAFPRVDYPWLASATRKLLRIASKCPAKQTPLVAMHCDQILNLVGDTESMIRPVSGRVLDSDQTAASPVASPARDFNDRESQNIQLEQEFSQIPAEPIPHEPRSIQPLPDSDTSRPEQLPPRDGTSPILGSDHAASPQKTVEPPTQNPAPQPIDAPQSPASKSAWAPSVFRMLPAAPINPHSFGTSATGAGSSAPNSIPVTSTHSGQPTRELLMIWRDAAGKDRAAAEAELASRGFRHLPARLVKQYLSDDFAERSRVVDTVLTEPNVDARPWLLLLAEDESSEVRLLAVTVMASSDDKALVEKALQVAVRDRDPRIADLASRLRQRRSGTTTRR